MVGKTYLRYVVGPQGGVIASSASLTLASTATRASYSSARPSTFRGPRHGNHDPMHEGAPPASVLFVPSLEAVRVFSVRSGACVHTLIPAEAKLPLEVTAVHVVPLAAGAATLVDPHRHIEESGWMLLVGYTNGHVAVFTCGPGNNYGNPMCRFYALGHRVDTNVLALAVDDARSVLCSGGQDTDITIWDIMGQEPVCRLRGHRGGVVSLQFPRHKEGVVISAAADGLIKVWDLALRQCVQTVIASDTQITSAVMDCEGRRLYCGLRENFLKVYRLEGHDDDEQQRSNLAAVDTATENDHLVVEHGTVARKYHKPVTNLSFSPDWSLLLASTSKTVEVYRILTAEDVKRKAYRKKKRRRGKATEGKADHPAGANGKKRRTGEEGEGPNDASDADESGSCTVDGVEVTASEEVVLLRTFFMTQKVRAACFVVAPKGTTKTVDALHIAVTFNNNSVQTYTTSLSTTDVDGAATWTLDLRPRHALEQQGHQSDIRSLLFVDNDSTLLSMSKEKVLMWSLSVRQDFLESDHTDHHDFYDAQEANLARITFKGKLNCSGGITLDDDAVAMAAISSSMCCVGLANGTVSLLDVASSEVTFTEPAIHVGGVKGVTKRPDDSGFLSVGADRRLILWTVGVLKDGKTPTLLQSMEVELTESPLFAAFSPDSRFLGVGLQSNNIQLFFADTLKPYLSLFGHKLPPTSLAFTSDGTLCASTAMDKSVRFWGTDFGDCHRAIHAHDDYVTEVEFVKGTHYAFTSSMDGSVKEWDGDNWTMIQMFRQHHRGVWSVAVTANGTCVASAGADKCIRCYLRTQDIVFPDEEEEKMGQEAMDDETARRAAMQKLQESEVVDVMLAGHQTAATAEAAERLMEALDLISVEQQRQDNPDDTSPRHPLLQNTTEWAYLWSIMESIRPSEVRYSLASLTSVHVDALLNALEKMIEHKAVLNYEIAAKYVLALVMPTPGKLAALSGLRSAAISGDTSEVHGARRLEHLRRSISAGLDETVSRIDYNIAGLQMVRQFMEDTEKVKFFDRSKVQGYKKQYHSRALLGGKKD